MRGTPSFPAMGHGTSWIIPAHAGNTEIDDLVKSLFGDHPRACGEHWPTISAWPSTRGSSPRMRGTLYEPESSSHINGIIPAHAGNTGLLHYLSFPIGDHPRACGEHRYSCSLVLSAKGSSPRMRGTPHGAHGERLQLGIIPAHAGNTCSRVADWRWKRNHPRACGEHTEYEILAILLRGSSPRMRGTPHQQLAVRYRVRIIPAHAGNTDRISECTR